MTAAPTSQTDPRAAHGSTFARQVQAMMSAFGEHESGMNYKSRSGSSSASGAYQYTDGTWNNYKGYRHAWQAPKSVQDERMRHDVIARYNAYGGDWRKVIVGHFYPAWVNHPEKWDQIPTGPGSDNPTVNQYIASVLPKFQKYSGVNVPQPQAQGVSATGGNVSGNVDMSSVTGTGVNVGVPLPKNASAADIRDYVAKLYPYMVAYLNDPELGPILIDAAQGGWDQQHLEGALFDTKWWKHTQASAREWDANEKLDGRTAEAKVAGAQATIATQAAQLGITLDGKTLHALARQSLRLAWNPSQVTAALASKFNYSAKATYTGSVGTSLDQLKAMAHEYGVPLSDSTLTKWVDDMVANNKSAQDFSSYIIKQAQSLYPTIGGQIDADHTTKQYLDPYYQIASQTLDKPVTSFDLMDPRWNKAINTVDPATGKRGPMALSDWTTYLRKLPEYKTTTQANDLAAQAANGLLKTFGYAS